MIDDPVEIFGSTIDKPVKKKRRKNKSLKSREQRAEEKGFTKRDISIVKANLAMPEATLLQKGKAAGLVGKDSNIVSTVSRTLDRVRDQTSKNEYFQRLLKLKGAGMEEIAQATGDALQATTPFRGRETEVDAETGKLVTKDITKMVPDHRTRMMAAQFAADAQQLMPEKKQTVEIKTYEEKVAIIAEIKANPQEAMARIQHLLESRRKENESKGPESLESVHP